MQGDTAKAKVAYQEFLTLWKDADPDIPILKEAKAEYAKLPSSYAAHCFKQAITLIDRATGGQ